MVKIRVVFFQFHEMKLEKKLLRQGLKNTLLDPILWKSALFSKSNCKYKLTFFNETVLERTKKMKLSKMKD